MFTYVIQSWWVNSNQTHTGKPEIWFCCSAITAGCKDFPLILLTGVAAYLCLKVILKGKKAQSRATPGKKNILNLLPLSAPSHTQRLSLCKAQSFCHVLPAHIASLQPCHTSSNKSRMNRNPSRSSIFLYNPYLYLGCSKFQAAVSKWNEIK